MFSSMGSSWVKIMLDVRIGMATAVDFSKEPSSIIIGILVPCKQNPFNVIKFVLATSNPLK